MSITERDLLDEIGNLIKHNDVHGSVHTSTRSARKFFDPLDLPVKLDSYIKGSRRQSLASAAKMFGISAQSLKTIIGGGPLSENMLFRLRNSLEYALVHPGISVEGNQQDIYFGDWRATETAEVQDAISDLAKNLIFLKRLIESSNIINSSDSPIDKIQIAQLIALLESTLAAVKGPFVETNQTSGFFRFLKKVAKRGAEKGVETAVTHAIENVVKSGSDLLEKLGDAPGTADIGTIIT